MKFSREKLRAPQTIFILYMLASCLIIMGFRFILPGSNPPLLIFSRDWRLISGLLNFFELFPALVFSALVIPFGLVSFEDYHSSFSPSFLKRLIAPIFIAITSAAIYGIILFLLLPMTRDYEENMSFKGELYRLAKERAQIHSRAGEWDEAAQFTGICDTVWPNSPELAILKTEIGIHLEGRRIDEGDERAKAREALAGSHRPAAVSGLPGQQPVDAAQAIAMSEAAFSEGRYFDSHWLATLGERIAVRGSPEAASAARLAGRAWNQIDSLAPNRREEQLFSLYNLKRSGYRALNSGDWIQAYYIFRELAASTPDDPDAVNFLAVSEKGTSEIAFFIDEMKLSLGEILTGAVFSMPGTGADRRAVLRFSSLSASQDFAYGMGLEYISFDSNSNPVVSLRAPYAKLLPITIDNRPRVMVLMRALDRNDRNLRWEPEWLFGSGDTRILLGLSYDNFLLLSLARQGLPNLQIDELLASSKILGSAGHVPQIYQAEVLNRLGALFFLPMAVIAIAVGWRFRARSKPRYFFILMFPILPVVFNGAVFLYRTVLNTLGIWLVLSLGFGTALIVFIAALVVFFFLSLILLAAQHG